MYIFVHFRFHLKYSSVLSQWLKEVRRKNFGPTKYSFICSEHFIDTDYQIRPGSTVKLLNTNAVPSVFNGFPTHLLKSLPVKQYNISKQVCFINYNGAKYCTNNIHYVLTSLSTHPRICIAFNKYFIHNTSHIL